MAKSKGKLAEPDWKEKLRKLIERLKKNKEATA